MLTQVKRYNQKEGNLQLLGSYVPFQLDYKSVWITPYRHCLTGTLILAASWTVPWIVLIQHLTVSQTTNTTSNMPANITVYGLQTHHHVACPGYCSRAVYTTLLCRYAAPRTALFCFTLNPTWSCFFYSTQCNPGIYLAILFYQPGKKRLGICLSYPGLHPVE